MQEFNIIRDENQQSIINKILFDRPISRLHARKIGLLAGRHARLKVVSDVYQIITTLNHDTILVAEEALKEHILPASIFLESGKHIGQGFTNTDDAFDLLSECEYIVVGMDLEIGAQFQLFLEKLISTRTAPIVFTNESITLGKTSPEVFVGRTHDLYVCNTQHLLTLAKCLKLDTLLESGAGILNKFSFIKTLSRELQATIVCVEDYQILAIDYVYPDKAVISNIKNTNNHHRIDLLFTAILTSLLCDSAGSKNDVLGKIVTASYLLRAVLDSQKKLPAALTQVLEV